MPLYSRVTFSEHPYSEALRVGDFQKEIMDEIMKMENIKEKWDSEEIENAILEKLSK